MENLLEHLASKISLLTTEFFLTTRLIRWTLSLFFFRLFLLLISFCFRLFFTLINQSIIYL